MVVGLAEGLLLVSLTTVFFKDILSPVFVSILKFILKNAVHFSH